MLISLILSAKDKTQRKQRKLPLEEEYSSHKGIFLTQRILPFVKEASLLGLGGNFLFNRSRKIPLTWISG